MRAIACAVLGVALSACGLDVDGTNDVGDAGLGDDATSADVANDATGMLDGVAPGMDGGRDATSDAAADVPLAVDSAGPCANTPASCGAPGQCVACIASPNGHACVMTVNGHACGCNSAAECPTGTACSQVTHTCSASCAGNLECAGGCCDGFTCQAGTENAKCGQNGNGCQACGGQTPTCGSNGNCTAACGAPGDGTCGNNTCCNAGTCSMIGDRSCGPVGQACVDCMGNVHGSKCVMINATPTCGCGGPGNPGDCPPGMACRNNQCTTSCDGQHPCNGGCCSQQNNGMCIALCFAGTCQGNYCQ